MKSLHTVLLLGVMIFACTLPASAHKSSDAYLNLVVQGAHIEGQWDISLRDLDFALGLDADSDGQITWGEVKARQKDIDAYALARLEIAADGESCRLSIGERLIDAHSDGGYHVIRISATCSHDPMALTINYRLFANIDSQHKGLLKLQAGNTTQAAIFGQQTAQQTLRLVAPSVWRQFADYFVTGAAHIWTGYDHILFLISLLLPAALVSYGGKWTPGDSFQATLIDVLKIVTSFTIAHSITLALASLQIVVIPARISESMIALSVVLAALNNLYPLVRGKRWLVAGCFGFVHGFGFANTLTELGLSESSLFLALAGFNLGVEAGQVAIVGVFLPLAWGLRRTWLYQRAVLLGGSCSVATIAALWFLERSLNLNFLPVH